MTRLRKSVKRKNLGFMMIVTAISLFVLVGMLGLAADLGRVYVVKSEAQAFADLVSIAAARHLNGKQSGITAANTEVTNSTSNKWNFGTQSFAAGITTVEFSTSAAGAWSTAPASAANVAFVRLTVTPAVTLSFMPALGTGYTQTVMGRAIAGIVPQQFPLGGYMPFTPFAHSNTDPNFGFTVGQEYGFHWPGNLNAKGNACTGDQVNWPTYNFSDQVGGSTRGYFELQAASAIADAILGGKQTLALHVGDVLNMTNGNKQAEQNALETRAGYDTDSTAYNWVDTGIAPSYVGNGMRLVVMPVNSGPSGSPAYSVLGFASFLLPMTYPNSGNKPWCAIYMGSRTAGGDTGNPFNVAGAYVVRLQQ